MARRAGGWSSAKAQTLPKHAFLENTKKMGMAGLCEMVISGR